MPGESLGYPTALGYDMSSIGEYLPQLLERQYDITEKSANRYFGRKPIYPTITGFNPNLPPQVKGVEMEDEYGNIIVAYNPNIVKDKELMKTVPAHEGIHLNQRGKKELLSVFAIYKDRFNEYIFPVGLALLEGGAELILEKIGEQKTGSYKSLYEMAKEIDKIYPLRDLYDLAEEQGPYAVINVLNQPDIKRIIGKYICNECSRHPNYIV